VDAQAATGAGDDDRVSGSSVTDVPDRVQFGGHRTEHHGRLLERDRPRDADERVLPDDGVLGVAAGGVVAEEGLALA
jgi:hypothetical protein